MTKSNQDIVKSVVVSVLASVVAGLIMKEIGRAGNEGGLK